MKKVLILAAVLVGLGFLVRRAASTCGSIDWEQRFNSMPDNAPPKWMFTNIKAIRENTERIIELLERKPAEAVR
jgi:hypothetical protein